MKPPPPTPTPETTLSSPPKALAQRNARVSKSPPAPALNNLNLNLSTSPSTNNINSSSSSRGRATISPTMTLTTRGVRRSMSTTLLLRIIRIATTNNHSMHNISSSTSGMRWALLVEVAVGGVDTRWRIRGIIWAILRTSKGLGEVFGMMVVVVGGGGRRRGCGREYGRVECAA